jgi:hypothetical protein
VFRGKLTVQGDAYSNTATAVGNNSGMGWCGSNGLTGDAFANDTGGDVKVTVGPASTCLKSGSNKLPATGSIASTYGYRVTYVDYGFYNRGLNRDCMANGGDPNTIDLGSISVNSSGNGGGTWYSIPGSGPIQDHFKGPWEAGVCVSDDYYSTSLYGIQAPLSVI